MLFCEKNGLKGFRKSDYEPFQDFFVDKYGQFKIPIHVLQLRNITMIRMIFYFITLVIQTPAEKVFGPQKYTSTKKTPNLRRYDLMSRVRTPEILQGILRSFHPPKVLCIKHLT